MEFDTDAARAALESAVGGDESFGAPEQATPEGEVPSGVESGATASAEQPDSFTNIDPNTLSPELQAIYKQMQGDYTRKTQGLSERSREFDSLGGIDQVRSAVEFVQALRDPDNLVQLHGELSEYLQAQGHTKAEADAVAASEVRAQVEAASEEEDWYSDPQADALKRELDELKQWREQVEAERMQDEIEQALARQETKIRQDNPHYSEDDIKSIYQRSYAFGGDLAAAQSAYEEERQRILSAYAQAKAAVPAGTGSPAPGASAQAPESFGSDLNAAHQYAKQRAAAILAMTEGS